MNRKNTKYRGTKCLNCETSLDISEKYCHHCGQLNSTKKLTIKDFIEEFFANFYAYDSRLRNSIFSIFTKPGVLAREFNQGKRHTYANPFRLFLSVSIVLFITFNLTEDESEPNYEKTQKKSASTNPNEDVRTEKDSVNFKILGTDVVLGTKNNLDITYSKDSIYTADFINKNINSNFDPIIYSLLTFKNFNIKYPQKTSNQCFQELGFQNNIYNKLLYKKALSFKTNDIEKEIGTYFYEKLPFLIFISLPILTLMFSLVFYSKNVNYTEHLVFAYTFFTFMFLCMLIFNFIALFNANIANFIGLISFSILFPLYFYKSLRNFYKQSRWKTVLKFVILNPLFFLFLSFCTIIMLFLGILLF